MIKKSSNSVFSRVSSNPKNEELQEIFSEFLKFLEKEKGYTKENIVEVLGAVKEAANKKEFNGLIPASIFSTPKLSSLEIIVKYLKEEHDFSYHEIALMLNRNDRTIWATYNNSKKKHLPKLYANQTIFFIPVSIFKQREFGVLELICEYFKDELNFSYHEIAVLVNRNDRTVWTTYSRAKKKRLDEKRRS